MHVTNAFKDITELEEVLGGRAEDESEKGRLSSLFQTYFNLLIFQTLQSTVFTF